MFTIPRGATKTFTITVSQDGALVDLTDAKLFFTVRVNDVVIISKANTAGGGSNAQIEVTAVGTFKIKILNVDTTREPVTGTCDGFVVTSAGEYLQAISNQPFQVTQAMTRVFPP